MQTFNAYSHGNNILTVLRAAHVASNHGVKYRMTQIQFVTDLDVHIPYSMPFPLLTLQDANSHESSAQSPMQPPHPQRHPLHTPPPLLTPSPHGTNSRENPTTSCRQQTHVPKLFIASETLHSSHRLKQRHGHARIVLGLLWQTTHCGPPGPRPSAP